MNLTLPAGKVQLDILVENLGRINYGPYLLKNNKGITERVSFAGKDLQNWQMFSLPMDDLDAVWISGNTNVMDIPVLKKGSFTLSQPGDSYLDLSNWGKGNVWINGHNLGRYWYVGPQQTIYVPKEWLKKGKNDIMIWELLKPEQSVLQGIDKPILDQVVK